MNKYLGALFIALWIFIPLASIAEDSTSADNSPFTLKVEAGAREEQHFLTNHSPEKTTDYSYSLELGDESKELLITTSLLPASLVSIESRYTTTTALDDEGPWFALPSLDKYSKWQQLAFSQNQATIRLALPTVSLPNKLQYSVNQIMNAARKEIDPIDQGRWLKVAQKCNLNNNVNPCYQYKSEDTFRLKLANGKVILLRIYYPGGC